MSEIVPFPGTAQVTPPQPTEYVWATYWGGAARGSSPPQIHAKLRDLRLAVGGLTAKKQQGGPMFPVKSAKELANKLGQALTDLDLIAPVIAQEIEHLDTDRIPGNSTASGKPVFRTLVHVKATVRVGAPDGSFVDFVGSGHGGDGEDKSGGKASTYAWKDAILKGLSTPEQDMIDTDDEQPAEVAEKAPKGGKKASPATPPQSPEASAAAANEALHQVLKLIKDASTVPDLDAIAGRIKSGELALAGADKLRATTAFVARKKVITTLEQEIE